MKNLIILFALLCIGCTGPVTKWHGERMVEIEQAYSDGEISKSEYLDLKIKADGVLHDANSKRRAAVLSD